jgi:hypothetical protein
MGGTQNEICGFCPGGYGPEYPNAAFEGNITCGGQHESLFQYSNMGTELCNAARFQILLKDGYPFQCGYCDTASADDGLCTLCSDGSRPTADPETVADDGESCGTKALGGLNFEAGSEICAQHQALFAETCGCPLPETLTDTSASPVIVKGFFFVSAARLLLP